MQRRQQTDSPAAAPAMGAPWTSAARPDRQSRSMFTRGGVMLVLAAALATMVAAAVLET